MSEKSKFYGDVGQAVVGNVNEAARLSNVVNLTIGSVRPEFQALTKLQRKDVTVKVRAIVALGGGPIMDVYRVLLNNFGAVSMNAFPGDKYMAAMALLDARIAATRPVVVPVVPVAAVPAAVARAATVPAAATRAATVPAAVIRAVPIFLPRPETVRAPMPCIACTRHAAAIKRVRATVLAQWVLLLGSTLLCGWLLLPSAVDAAPVSPELRCYFDGKSHSAGSSVRMPNGSMRECVIDGMDGVPRWAVGARK